MSMLTRLARAGLWALLGALILPGSASATEPTAVLTELRVGAADVGIRRSGESTWIPAQPLLALRPGDQLRATGNAQAVILFAGGSVQTVSAANSPFVVQAPRGRSGTENTQAFLGGVIQFLMGQQREPRYEQLAVRGPTLTPRIVSPRDTRLLPGPVTLEWMGPASLRYQVKVVGPQGVVWDQDNLPRQPVQYPASAPPLKPGARYTWLLTAPGQPDQQAQFEVVPTAEASRIQTALASVRSESPTAYPPSTVSVIRVGLLLHEKLYADARRELLARIATEPASPTFRELLGVVYDRTGLEELAVVEFEEASMLSRPKP